MPANPTRIIRKWTSNTIRVNTCLLPKKHRGIRYKVIDIYGYNPTANNCHHSIGSGDMGTTAASSTNTQFSSTFIRQSYTAAGGRPTVQLNNPIYVDELWERPEEANASSIMVVVYQEVKVATYKQH